MAKPKITVLIALIGKHPEHVQHFIRENINLKKIYLLHTCDKDQPSSRDGDVEKSVCNECGRGGPIDYGKLAAEFVRKLKQKHKSSSHYPIKIISKLYQDAHDINELQEKITDIVEEEKDGGALLKNIALEISGGTNIAAAAQIFAIYNLGIVPFYVDNQENDDGEWVRPIKIPTNWGKTLSPPAKQLLTDIANSKFTVKGKDMPKTPKGEDPRTVEGQITRQDLKNLMQSRIKKIGKVARPSVSSLKGLEKFKLIEILPKHEVYRKKSNVGEPEWILDEDRYPAYKATESGKIAARRLKINPE